MPLEFSALTAPELQALPKAQTVFFFSVGPLEDHGPVIPVGLAVDTARASCWLTANRLESECPGWVGVLMPPLPLGLNSDTTALAITVRAHVLRDWLVDACRSLQRAGFLHFVCFTGQLGPHQLTAIEDAGRIFTLGKGSFLLSWLRSLASSLGVPQKSRATLVSASSSLVKAKEVGASPFFSDPLEHGGARDASKALAIYPNFGEKKSALASLPSRQRPASITRRLWLKLTRKTEGYWGHPAGGSYEMGQALLTQEVDLVFPKLRAVWSGSNPEFIFRSWYSVIPTNKSFFVAWLFTAGALVIFVLLIYLQMRDFL
jgi:creatinine amidohydrolase/Fe(II)-dependent formamide hydrolase-like protein